METGRVTPSRVTRSQHKHLQSESDNSSRPGTPVSTQSLDISPKDTGLRRTTRRLSTSTPSKLMGKLVKEGTPEVSTPSKRITRRNSTSIIEVDVQKSVKTPKFPTLAEEDVNSEKPKYGEKTRRKSISPKLRSQSDKISATTSRFTRSVNSNDVEDSEVEIININTDEDSQSSVIDVKIDKNAKKTIKGKKQKTSDEEKKDIKNSEVVKNNVKDTVKSTEEEEEETKDMKKPDSIANDKNSINIEEAAIEQPVEKKVYGEEIDLTEDNENSFKADENQSKEKSNKVFHNESGEVKIKVEHNESDVEMIEIDEGVVGIDIKKEQEDEGKNIGNDDKDIEMIKENVGEHKKENIKINDTIMTNNVVINVTNTDAVIINGNKNIDPNTEPQALNKSLNELNVNKSYNDDVEIISHDLVIKDVLVNEIVSDSKVSNTDLNKNNSILEASNIQVPNSDLKNDNNILESSSIDMPNTDLQKNNSILETSNIEMPNTDQKNNSILEASNIEVPNTDLQKNNSILEASNIEVTNTDPQKNNSILEASNIEVPNTDLQKNNNILEASNIEVDLEQNENQAQTSNEVHKIKSSAGDIIETPITPKKKIHITTFNLPTGTVCVEPMTPCRKAIVNGFRESPFTPKCVGFKVESNCQDLSPTSSRKSRKRKRYIEEPKHSLPKPKWTQSGQFIEEDLSTGEIVNLKKGKKVDSLQLSKESALNFKNRALFRKNIQRESSQTLLRRKERGFQNKF
ncbi:slender lobes-like protein [Teleopsis dalmanni]|uniref:slender lobes-like protein n=1 Tax=Teleopsis dalmanni TaxID=139649 RepID=UPI0018CD9DD1|nr:slender lobes-like protein [Teleopsis dalmanni]